MAHLPDDRDLFSLSCSCQTFADALVPKDSAIWKTRFVFRYDHPNIAVRTDFSVAYRLRRFVLRSFVAFTNPDDMRLPVQLEVLRDMVIGMLPWRFPQISCFTLILTLPVQSPIISLRSICLCR